MRFHFLVCAFALAVVQGCGGDGSRPTEKQIAQAKVEAESAMDELQQRLSKRLTEALSEGSPEQALDLCATVAREVTEEVAAEKGLVLRRTALRYRNPDNAPTAREREYLQKIQAMLASGDSMEEEKIRAAECSAVRTDDGGWEYHCFRPIFVKEVCTLCHGTEDQISPATREAISRHYPDDRATGFAVGDLRGAFSVRK